MSSTLHNQVNGLLEKFGAEVGLDGCQLDDDGSVQLGFDGVLLNLMLDEAAGAILLMTTIGRPRATVETYAKLLDANLFFADTASATLARESGSTVIVLQRHVAVEGLDLVRFENVLTALVDTAERMREELKVEAAQDAQDDEAPDVDREVPEHFVRA